MQRSEGSRPLPVQAIVPAVLPWRGYWRAVINLLVLGVAVLTGTWIVHQSEYFIEYGQRFGTVMAANLHAYMAPVGGVLAALAVMLLALLAFGLHLAWQQVRQIENHLPVRLTRHLIVPARMPSVRTIGATSLVLALCQSVVYLAQENLESLAATGNLPGLSVLLAPHHATVLPLDLLIASCFAVLLWTVSCWLRRSRRLLHVASVFAALVARRVGPGPTLAPRPSHTPNRRLAAGIHGLRAPPL